MFMPELNSTRDKVVPPTPTAYRGSLSGSDTLQTAFDRSIPRYIGGTILSRMDRSWIGIGASLIDLRCDGSLTIDLHSETPQLSVILERVGGRLAVGAPDRASNGDLVGKATLSLLPADVPTRIVGESMAFVRHLILRLDPLAIRTTWHRTNTAPLTAAPYMFMFADEPLLRICRLFEEEFEADQPDSPSVGDVLSICLYKRLSAIATPSAGPPATGLYRGGLSPHSLRRVTSLMEEDLSTTIPVFRLANAAGLSVSHFKRAFKSSTGLPPRRWLMRTRCERAKVLMLESRKGLAEIALDVGFCDQAHFSRCFAGLAGSSPSAWRRARR